MYLSGFAPMGVESLVKCRVRVVRVIIHMAYIYQGGQPIRVNLPHLVLASKRDLGQPSAYTHESLGWGGLIPT